MQTEAKQPAEAGPPSGRDWWEELRATRDQRLLSGLINLLVFTGAMSLILIVFGDTAVSGILAKLPKRFRWMKKVMPFVSDYALYIYYFSFIGVLVWGLVKKNRALVRVGLIYMLIQLVGSVLITRSLKIIIGRPRPGHGGMHHFFSLRARYNSFPSGHSADAFCSAGTVWMFSSSTWLTAASYFLTLIITISRVLTGAHYLLDVVAGITIGWLSALLVGYRALKKPIEEETA
jgi:undecaprenyl-diphosphatase